MSAKSASSNFNLARLATFLTSSSDKPVCFLGDASCFSAASLLVLVCKSLLKPIFNSLSCKSSTKLGASVKGQTALRFLGNGITSRMD